MPVLSCGMWDLLPQRGIKPRPPALKAPGPSHGPPGKSLKQAVIIHMHCSLTLGSRRYIILYRWVLLILQQELGQFSFLVSFRIVILIMDEYYLVHLEVNSLTHSVLLKNLQKQKKSQPKNSYVFSYFLTNFTHKLQEANCSNVLVKSFKMRIVLPLFTLLRFLLIFKET